jgi:hypothetical protein
MAGIPDGCDAVLIRNTDVVSLNESQKMEILTMISEKSYSEVQRQAGLDFSIPGVPVSFSGDYSSFDQQRKSYLNHHRFSTERNVALDTVRTFVRPDQVSAWLQCKEWQARNNFGFRCWHIRQDIEDAAGLVTVAFSWNPPPDGQQHGVVDSQLVNGTSLEPNVPNGQAFPVNFHFIRGIIYKVFRRDLDQTFVLTVNVNNIYSDEVHLGRRPKPQIHMEQYAAPPGDQTFIVKGRVSQITTYKNLSVMARYNSGISTPVQVLAFSPDEIQFALRTSQQDFNRGIWVEVRASDGGELAKLQLV